MFFPKKYKICILILILLNFLGNSLDMLVYLNFGTQISPEMMNIFFESNLNEAKEFTNSYLNKKILLLIPYYIIGGLLLIKIKTKIFIKMLALTFATIILAINILKIEGSTYFRKTYIYKNISRSYSRYKKSAEETKKLMENFEERFKDIKVKDEMEEATYVMVIGESFSKHHSSLYGYKRDTNPNLLNRKKNGEIVIFDDVVSPHHYTRDTLLKLVSDYSHESEKSFGESMNIIDLFKKAGYKTYWLSNQEDFAYNQAGLSSVANRADEVVFTEKSLSDTKVKLYDEYLIPHVKKALEDDVKKKFIVIHLFGSHLGYANRYPKEFSYFEKDSYEEYFSELQKKNKGIVNEYHNSLRYNDYLINNIIDMTDKSSKNSYLLYLSDHGQIVYDDNTDFVGNSLPTVNKKAVEIPLIVWMSQEYREKNKENVENFELNAKKRYSSEDIFYSIVDLSRLNYSEQIQEKSIFSEKLVEKDRRISSEGLIYESLIGAEKSDEKKDSNI
ncbi:MAG: phosphoethanolamine transferase [Cetobacterium sp.]|uniref:phosphoethanolamine transferase n=1 Tax=Cetobacterium sp. TaxID=2071632 RepID=UPI002FC9C547